MWVIIAMYLVSTTEFIQVELKSSAPLVDFKIFSNAVFSGATLSSFLINATAGLIPASLWVLQGAVGMIPQRPATSPLATRYSSWHSFASERSSCSALVLRSQ
ncbi:hypothetical protein [Corynebacterium renale]|uniref:hypothetical protein n=1 Tax=Corynebacterium renale TaxID=1724 RepID=UPI000DA2D3FE|nr:hypothetical protein [Corynebacterium renale]SQI19805.1 permease [Corynebacterium renale]